jgi:hypothetical protein
MATGEPTGKHGMTRELLGYLSTLHELKGSYHERREQIIMMRFRVLTAASMKFRIFWDVAQCSHVEVDRRFRRSY